LRIGIVDIGKDAKTLKGLGRYATDLITHLKQYPDIEISVLLTGEPRRVKVWTSLPRKLLKDRSDLYHATNPDVAITPVLLKPKVVVTFHDLIPLYISRQAYSWHAKYLSKLYVNTVWKTVAKRASKIISVSTQTKEELIETFNLSEEKIAVLNNPVSDAFKPLELDKKYFIFVGNYSFRKRVDLAIKAYKEFLDLVDKKEDVPKLVIVGGYLKTKHQRQFDIQSLIRGLEDKVIIKAGISDEELNELYNQSLALLFTSEYEGFGLPVLEAARTLCIPITRKEARIPKEVKEVSISVETSKIPELLVDIYENYEQYKSIAKEFYEKSLKYNWNSYIEKLLKIYQDLINS
jgi:mannosyltransferase